MRRDSVVYTLTVATVLCVACSVLVSAAAVGLRSKQEANKRLDRQKNVILAAGLLQPEEITPEKIESLFAEDGLIRKELVDLKTGKSVGPEEELPFDLATYDPRDAAKDPDLGVPIPAKSDPAGIKRRARYQYVYKVLDDKGSLKQIVVPIYGKGLWSTLYGFLALEDDFNTVDGITYYEHGETPGLGAEVQNPKWTAQWVDKTVYGKQGKVQLGVVKGAVKEADAMATHQVDGLSGATITSNGVTNMIHYWLGPEAFGPYLKSLSSPNGAVGTSVGADGTSVGADGKATQQPTTTPAKLATAGATNG